MVRHLCPIWLNIPSFYVCAQDFQSLKDFFSSQFKKDLREVELCVKGWNWGDAKFEGALLSFMVDSKPAFEIPLEEVSQAIPGKNEITLEFHQNDDTPVSLVEMRFHIPNVEGSEDPVKVGGGGGPRHQWRTGYWIGNGAISASLAIKIMYLIWGWSGSGTLKKFSN